MTPKIIALTFFVAISLPYLFAQNSSLNTPLYSWRVHLPYRNANCIATTYNKAVVGTPLAMFDFMFDTEKWQIITHNKATGLSDLDITAIQYFSNADAIVIGYANGNIDIQKNGNVYNIPYLKQNANIIGSKRINHIFANGNTAYLATNIGIIVLDIETKIIKDTYKVGFGTQTFAINKVVVTPQKIVAATTNGVFEAPTNDPFLSNPQNWQLIENDLPVANATSIVQGFKNRFFAVVNDVLYYSSPNFDTQNWTPLFSQNGWQIKNLDFSDSTLVMPMWKGTNINNIETANITLIDSLFNISKLSDNTNEVNRPIQALIKPNDKSVYVADLYKGLTILYKNYPSVNVIPIGPNTANTWRMAVKNNNLWIATGGLNDSYGYLFRNDGFYKYDAKQGEWATFNQYAFPEGYSYWDFIDILPHPQNNKIYIASFGFGLWEYDGTTITRYMENTALQTTIGDPTRYRTTALDTDSKGNLWIANAGTAAPFVVKKNDNTWQAFEPKDVGYAPTLQMNDILVNEEYNQIWGSLFRNGIIVLDYGTDLQNTTDDQYIKLSKEGMGQLPDNTVNCIQKDKNGAIWVGTANGVAVFYCPYNLFQQGGCTAEKPYIEVEGIGALLLEKEDVKAIAIDGANRKWIGTTNGVYLISAEGNQQLQHFNTQNSPLLSNIITSIAIDTQTGEVYIGTEKGLVSYRGNATEGTNTHANVLVYPNPVPPNYTGEIIIKGLPQNAKVKITDITGALVHQTTALGGQAIWDTQKYNGTKPATGVYLVFSSNPEGTDTFVTKFLYINGN